MTRLAFGLVHELAKDWNQNFPADVGFSLKVGGGGVIAQTT